MAGISRDELLRFKQFGAKPDVEYVGVHISSLALEKELRDRVCEIRHTESKRVLVENCVAELRSVLAKLGQEWTCEPFGSFVNGFGMADSDLDVTCFQPDAEILVSGSTETWLSTTLRPYLERHPCFSVSHLISASIPILKLMYCPSPGRYLEVDLSCHNKVPLANTHLLRAYSELDPVVRDLGIAVKFWAKSSGVCEATMRNLSSYTFNLLTIYYMQVDPDVRLPCLPTDAFAAYAYGEVVTSTEDPRIQEASSWSTSYPLAELLLRFFRFYAQEFRWGTEVASIRQGRRLNHDDPTFQMLRGRWSGRIHIEDPYQWERNLNCVLGEPEEAKLHASFVAMLHMQSTEALLPLGLCKQAVSPISAPTAAPSSVESDDSNEPVVIEDSASEPSSPRQESWSDSHWYGWTGWWSDEKRAESPARKGLEYTRRERGWHRGWDRRSRHSWDWAKDDGADSRSDRRRHARGRSSK